MQQTQIAAAAAAGQPAVTFHPVGNRSLIEHSLSQEVPHKPPYMLWCRDRHLVGRVQFAGGVLSEKRHSQKNPRTYKTKQLVEPGRDRIMERKSEEGNKTQNEKLQRDRRLWNGNTKSKQLVIKKINNQTATKPSIQGQRQNLEGCSPTEEMRTYGPPSCKKKKNPARGEYKLMSLCFQSHIDATVFFQTFA